MKSPQRLPLGEIRRQQYEYHRKEKYPDYYEWRSPYTWLKSRFYIECATLIVFLIQGVRLHPDQISRFYGLLGALAGILLAVPNKICTLIAVFIFFGKGVLDGVDGHLARIKGLESEYGARLDALCGKIGTVSFYVGLSFYLAFNLAGLIL